MKNKVLLSILLAGSALSASAQYKYSFDDGLVPAAWTCEKASLSINAEHYSDGTKSLAWEVEAGQKGQLTLQCSSFSPSSSAAAIFDVYSFSPSGSDLTVEFLNSAKAVQATANLSVCFRGWRQFQRCYNTDFGTSAKKDIAYVRFTLDNSALSSKQRLLIDRVNINGTANASRLASDWMIKDVDKLPATMRTILNVYSFAPEAATAAPSAQEIADIETVKAKYTFAPKNAETPRLLRDTRTYVNNLGIVRNSDGTVRGKDIHAPEQVLTATQQTELLTRLNNLAGSTLESDKTLFRDLLDLTIEQGVMYRFPRMPSNTYNIVRETPCLLFNILGSCTTDEQYDEVLKMAEWVSESRWAYAPDAYLGTEFSSDIIYNYLAHFMAHAVYQRDKSVACRELKAISRFLERTLTPVRGGYDTIKPDWTGFHHGTHYNNYMYCYLGWTEAAYALKGTSFRISPKAYNYMKNAVLAMYKMSNRNASGVNITANSLAGRHPFDGGQINQYKKSYFENLIEISADVLGQEDSELGAAYNYFFLTDKYTAPEADYSGYYQFNYSPIAVYRTADWVVTMRSPTTRTWGAEIYSGTSRFSRYQSHGTMEVVYNGDGSNSGHPSTPTGYDWNVCPGGTTVHYTSWLEMMPKSSTTQRFDQFTLSKNFSGALAWNWDKCGVFACDFDQVDSWGTQCFTPTNLVFKKSVYAFDGMLISLGSNISSSGSYGDDRITATNLFQEVGANMGALKINGTDMAEGDTPRTPASTADCWMVTPKGTGYFVPKGNAQLNVRYAEQEGPNEDGSDVASPAKAIGAKAYLNHGSKAKDGKYEFVMVPGTTAEKMKDLSAKLSSGANEFYTVHSQNENFHALTYKPKNITAYSFFKPVNETGLPVLRSTASEMLVMQQLQEDGTLLLAVCNPNLRPQSVSSALGDWTPGTTETSLVLEGEWYAQVDAPGCYLSAPAGGCTKVNLTLNDGMPVYIQATHSSAGTGITELPGGDKWIEVARNGQMLHVLVDADAQCDTAVQVYSLDGRQTAVATVPASEREAWIELPANGAYIVKATCGDRLRTIKCF